MLGQQRDPTIDTKWEAEEQRRRLALTQMAADAQQQRRRFARLDLKQFIRRRVSDSAADYLGKAIDRRTKQPAIPTPHIPPLCGTSSQAGPSAPGPSSIDSSRSPTRASRRSKRPLSARSSSGQSESSVNTVGYATHRYRSELRQTLQDLGMHSTQQPQWGKPAHFVPLPPQPPHYSRESSRQSRQGMARSSREGRAMGSMTSKLSSLRDRALSSAGPSRTARSESARSRQTGSQQGLAREHTQQRARPATARPALRAARDPTAQNVTKHDSIDAKDSLLQGINIPPSGFTPPPSWNAYEAKAKCRSSQGRQTPRASP